jgi:hypothetical protein
LRTRDNPENEAARWSIIADGFAKQSDWSKAGDDTVSLSLYAATKVPGLERGIGIGVVASDSEGDDE